MTRLAVALGSVGEYFVWDARTPDADEEEDKEEDEDKEGDGTSQGKKGKP